MKSYAVLLLLAPLSAHAEVAGNAATRATQDVSQDWTQRTFDFQGDVDWFRVQLAKGSDYYVTADCYTCTFDLRDYSGKILQDGGFSEDTGGPEGFEFRAPYKGLFFLEVKDTSSPEIYTWPERYQTLVEGDCPSGWSTRCHLSPGSTRSGNLADGWDEDAFKSYLVGGQTYVLTLTHPDFTDIEVSVEDPNGTEIWYGESTNFVAPKTGTYLLTVTTESSHGGGAYTLSLH